MKFLCILFMFYSSPVSWADTPPPGTVKAKMFSGDGLTSFTSTGSALNVNVTNTTGLTTVNQGAAGSSAWKVDGSGVTQPISASVLPLPTGASTSANQISPINTNSCNLTTASTSYCTMSTNGASSLTVTPSGSWSGLVGVECTATTSGNTGWEFIPLVITSVPASSQTFMSTNDNASLGIGGCARIQLLTLSGFTGSGTFTLSLTPGAPLVSSVISSTPALFYTTANIRDGAGNALASTSSALNVSVQNSSIPVTGTFWQTTQPVSLSVLPSLATGSNTIGAVNINGTVPVSGSITATNAANGTPDSTAPSTATQVAGSDGTNLRTLKASSTGVLSVDGSAVTQPVSAASLPLPSGASTSALQTTGNSSLSSIDGKTPALGQALSAASVPVVLPAAQITTLTPPTSVTVTQPTGTNLHTVVDSSALPTGAATAAGLTTINTTLGTPMQNSGGSVTANAGTGTFAVSASSLPLPTGAATASGLTTINTTLGTPMQQTGGTVTANAGTGTFAVSAAALPLPSGASTAANQTSVQSSVGASASTAETIQGNSSGIPINVADSLGNAQYNFPAGFVRTSDEPRQIFYDPFDSTLDTTNRWNATVSSGGGVAASVTAGVMTIGSGTTGNGYSVLTSQASFTPTIPGWLGNSHALKFESGSLFTTNAYRFWGAANAQASPTTSNPISDGYGFEIYTDGKMYAVTYAGGTRTVVQDLSSATGNSKQPTDGNYHRYIVFYRTDRIYWYIDSLASTSLVASVSFTGPQIQTLPLSYITVAGATPPGSSAVITSTGVAVWDTAKNNSTLSDGTFGWRKATIKPASTAPVATDPSLVVSLSPNSVLPLGTGAATSANQTSQITQETSIATNTANIPAKGLSGVTGATPVALPNATTVTTTAFNSSTGLINVDMLTGSANGWYDAAGYTSFFADIYTTTTVTGGVITFEQTNDTTNDAAGITMNIQDSSVITQTNVTTLTLVASTIKHYQAPITSRYIRFRLSTAFAGTGTVGATVNFKQTAYNPIAYPVSQATASSLASTSTIASGTVTTVSSVTSDNLAIPGIVADVTSAALLATTTTAAFTPTNGTGFIVNMPVTAAVGTGTFVVNVQESADTGNNWFTVYTFPTVNVASSVVAPSGASQTSPVLPLTGNRVRYVQTLTGITSVTRAINRLQTSYTISAPVNNNATFATATVSSSCSTLTAPVNAVGFILENLSSNTVNMFWTIGATAATSTTGMLLEPGRDTGEVHSGQNISLCSASGTPTYSLQWIQQ